MSISSSYSISSVDSTVASVPFDVITVSPTLSSDAGLHAPWESLNRCPGVVSIIFINLM